VACSASFWAVAARGERHCQTKESGWAPSAFPYTTSGIYLGAVPIRLIATDLDGTLVRSDGTISARTRSALQAAEQAGIGVAVLTGRPVRWMRQLIDETTHRGVAGCMDGAVLYDLSTGRVVHADPFTHDQVDNLARLLTGILPGVAIACERIDGCVRDPRYLPAGEIARDAQLSSLREMTTKPVVKLLARHSALGLPKAAAVVLEALRGAAYAAVVPSPGMGTPYLAMSPVGITKRSALVRLARDYHHADSSEVVAFGDMINDLPMLEWAGIGVAVANADPEVLRRADEVTGRNDEDGVAAWVERMLGSRHASSAARTGPDDCRYKAMGEDNGPGCR
jgi:HAD superfamily hydrolase (TIGR01484 family)